MVFNPPPQSIVIFFLALFATYLSCTAQSNIVATVDARTITQKEIDDTIAIQLLPLQQQIYTLRKAALDNYILAILIESQAKHQGMSVDAFKNALTNIKVDIDKASVESAYIENASAFAQMSPDEAKQRLRLDLETQARMRAYRMAVQKLREESHVTSNLVEPVLPITIPDNSNTIGNKDAQITLIEYGDFGCPHCRDAYPVIKKIIQTYGKHIRFVFKNLPLNQNSEILAESAFCAGEQGKFWQFHDILYSDQKTTLDSAVLQLGIEMSKFKNCQTSQTARAAVRRDAQEAKNLGVDGTPAFVFNGKVLQGFLTYEELKSVIEDEIKRLK